MLTITELENIGTACPSQWEGRESDGGYVYIRYRYGHLSVSVDGDVIFGVKSGDGLDGVMGTEKMKRILKRNNIAEFKEDESG